MWKHSVLKYFKTASRAAKAAGVTKSAVSQWKDLIPMRMAYQLNKATNGKLKFDPSLYLSSKADDAAA